MHASRRVCVTYFSRFCSYTLFYVRHHHARDVLKRKRAHGRTDATTTFINARTPLWTSVFNNGYCVRIPRYINNFYSRKEFSDCLVSNYGRRCVRAIFLVRKRNLGDGRTASQESLFFYSALLPYTHCRYYYIIIYHGERTFRNPNAALVYNM